MSKAEDLAEKAYPAWRNGIGDEFSSNSAYYGFIEGYHQAEKDMELTWEDVEYIIETYNRVEYSREFVGESYNGVCKEILKRFKERKKK